MGESNPPLQSTKCYFLSILLVAIAFLFPYLSVPLPVKQWLRSGELRISNIRHGSIETLPRLASSSYRTDSRTRFENLSSSQREGDGSTRNTVAVVLNWSRFQNVQRIVSLLCSPELDSIMKHVLVWNNNPKPVTYLVRHTSLCFDRTFSDGLSQGLYIDLLFRRKIADCQLGGNLYFRARFLGCSQSDAEYCFVQDDDYLILPEVIQTLHARVMEHEQPSAVYLLPPHERLSSDLHAMYTVTHNRTLHTSFSWLGHGAMMHRSLASEFLLLLQVLKISDEELKMADNYFTVLRNYPTETWFDQGIELGGGEAFTVGYEGHERNQKHILRACYYLDTLLGGDMSAYARSVTGGKLPYTFLDSVDVSPALPQGQAVCFGRPCLFETTIALLPNEIRHSCGRAQDMLDLGRHNLQVLGDEQKHYLSYPPSFAVDGKPDTAFRSIRSAAQGDTITLDMLRDISALHSHIEMALLVDSATEHILRTCIFETSLDGNDWTTLLSHVACVRVDLSGIGSHLVECSVLASHGGSEKGARYMRARLTGDREERWGVYEMWIRGYDN